MKPKPGAGSTIPEGQRDRRDRRSRRVDGGTPGESGLFLLVGWKSIAASLGVCMNTAKIWHRRRPLPIWRETPGGQPCLLPEDLDAWLRKGRDASTAQPRQPDPAGERRSPVQ